MHKLIPTLALAAALGACAGQGGGTAGPGEIGFNKTTGGGLLGAGLGGLAGSQFGGGKGKLVTTTVGVLAGALVGSEIGKSLDRADRAYAQQTTQRTLETIPSRETRAWSNPDSGVSGTVTPLRTYQPTAGTNCREYQQTITIGGRTEQGTGTACRQPDGSWRIAQ
jgi:surface antigen